MSRLFGNLPAPTTFAEGQQQRYGILVAAAGMFAGAMALGMVALLMWGKWSASQEHTIVVIFGWTLAGCIACMGFVIIGFLVGGPVGRLSGEVGKDGMKWDASRPDEKPVVKTTTETTIGGGNNGPNAGA